MTPEELNRLRRDLDFMMTRYEGELKQPIRNVVTGKLPRTLLIQVELGLNCQVFAILQHIVTALCVWTMGQHNLDKEPSRLDQPQFLR